MNDYAELGELLSAMTEGTLDDAGRTRLAALLRDDAEARAFYRRYLRVHLLMEVESAGGRSARPMWLTGTAVDSAAHPDLRPKRPQVRLGWRVAIGIAAAVLIAGAAAWVYVGMIGVESGATDQPRPRGPAIAVMLDAADVAWTSEPIEPGDSVDARPMEIGRGKIELETLDGTSMHVTGPARVALVDKDRARLWRGKLSARSVPGFTVELDHGVRVIDLGTAFEVDVADDGRAMVRVTEGRVRIERPGEAAYEMTAGERSGVNADRFDRPVEVWRDVAVVNASFEANDGDVRAKDPIGWRSTLRQRVYVHTAASREGRIDGATGRFVGTLNANFAAGGDPAGVEPALMQTVAEPIVADTTYELAVLVGRRADYDELKMPPTHWRIGLFDAESGAALASLAGGEAVTGRMTDQTLRWTSGPKEAGRRLEVRLINPHGVSAAGNGKVIFDDVRLRRVRPITQEPVTPQRARPADERNNDSL